MSFDCVLDENEKAFQTRYGISLEDQKKRMANEISKIKVERVWQAAQQSDDMSGITKDTTLLAMVMGFGDGKFIKNLKKIIPRSTFLVWEPDWDVFLYVCCNKDVSDVLMDDKITLVIGKENQIEEILEKEFRKLVAVYNSYHSVLFPMPGFKEIYSEYSEIMVDCFRKAIFELNTDVSTRINYKELNLKNELLALTLLKNNHVVDDLFDKIPKRDIPIIIVAAGPSLAKNVKELKNVGAKAIMIVVSHAAKTVIENGVNPHLIAIADSRTGESHLAFDTKRKLRLLINTKAVAEVQKQYAGKLIYESIDLELFPVERFRKETYLFPNGGSVATNAFGLFVRAGFRNIILVGQDLAYDSNGNSHAGGEKETRGVEKEIEGIDGEMVKSRGDWLFFLQNYERMIEDYSDLNVIDATEGGAKIHGSIVMPLKDAVEKYCVRDYPIDEWLADLPKGTVSEEVHIRQMVQNHYEKCKKMLEPLDRVIVCNRHILKYWREGHLGSVIHNEECLEYDKLYKYILYQNDADLLVKYCDDLLQAYMKDALSLEGDGSFEKKMDFECYLFAKMKMRNEELIEYIEDIFGENIMKTEGE